MLSHYQCHSRDMFFIFCTGMFLFLVHPSFQVVCLQILVRVPCLWFSCIGMEFLWRTETRWCWADGAEGCCTGRFFITAT